MADDHEHDDEHDESEHSHGEMHFQWSEVDDAVLVRLRELNPPLAESLEATRRWSELTDEERKAQPDKQREVEAFIGWTPGFHADGDKCAACGKPTSALFVDRYEEGALPFAAFLSNLPVHATKECLDAFPKARPDLSPRGVDRARRELTRDLNRPSAGMSQFFRHDVLLHPPFGLEDWGNSVAEANPAGLDKVTARDIQRLAHWVHHRMFHP